MSLPRRSSLRRAQASLLAVLALVTLGLVVLPAGSAQAGTLCRLDAGRPYAIHDIIGQVHELDFGGNATCVGVGRVQAVAALQHWTGRAWSTNVGPIYSPTVTSHSAVASGSTPYCFPGTYRTAVSGYSNGHWLGVVSSSPVYISCARQFPPFG